MECLFVSEEDRGKIFQDIWKMNWGEKKIMSAHFWVKSLLWDLEIEKQRMGGALESQKCTDARV